VGAAAEEKRLVENVRSEDKHDRGIHQPDRTDPHDTEIRFSTSHFSAKSRAELTVPVGAVLSGRNTAITET